MAAVEGSTTIQPAPSVMFDIERAEQNIKQWEEVKKKVLAKGDIVRIGTNDYIKRSGWRKLALAANVATSILEVRREVEGQWDPSNQAGDFTATVKARASASWGRWAEDVGTYSASEFVDRTPQKSRLPISRHNVIARAATRAINRAVSDLIGGGVVSAEEVASNGETGDGPNVDEVKYALREFENMIEVSEGLGGVFVKIKGNLPSDKFKALSKAMDEIDFGYVPADEGGPGFRPKE